MHDTETPLVRTSSPTESSRLPVVALLSSDACSREPYACLDLQQLSSRHYVMNESLHTEYKLELAELVSKKHCVPGIRLPHANAFGSCIVVSMFSTGPQIASNNRPVGLPGCRGLGG